MGQKLGMEAKLYYKTGGVAGQGQWTLLPNVKDVTLSLERGEADVTTRANGGWKATVGTLKDASVEFESVWDTEDAGFTALQEAFMNGTPIGIAVMDGDIATPGSQGLQADMAVTKFDRKEPLEEAITVSVTVKPTYSATAPAWATIAAQEGGGA